MRHFVVTTLLASLTLACGAIDDLGLDSEGFALEAGPDYADAVFRPSPNWGERPWNGSASAVIVHDCEGTVAQCVEENVQADGPSAHYVVGQAGVVQLVPEADQALRSTRRYDCSLNGDRLCAFDGEPIDHFAVHVVVARSPEGDSGLTDRFSTLVCDITADNRIPRDRYHVKRLQHARGGVTSIDAPTSISVMLGCSGATEIPPSDSDG